MNEFEGKAIIELTDVKTGKTETVESHNFMTNAIAKALSVYFFNLDWPNPNLFVNRANDIKHLEILKKFFSGLYIFDSNLGDDPDTFYAPAGVTLTGVGDLTTSIRSDDPCRGVYNTNLSGEYVNPDTEARTGYKFVWDFNQDQSNGQIGSLCLTTKTGAYITQGGKYSGGTDDYSVTADSFDRSYYPNERSGETWFRPWVDLTGWNIGSSSSESYYLGRLALLKIDFSRSTIWTFNDARELTYCAGLNYSGDENFKQSLFYKKSVSLLECRYPISKYSVFTGTPYTYTEDYSTADMYTKVDTKTIQMPTELATIIDTALERGSTKQYYVSPFTTSDYLYLIMHIDEGFGQVNGIPTTGHYYIWRINLTTWESDYFSVENTTEENIGYTEFTFGKDSSDYAKYFLRNCPVIVQDKYLVTRGYTTKKIYIFDITGNEEVKIAKYGYDKTTEYITTADTRYLWTGHLYRNEQCVVLGMRENGTCSDTYGAYYDNSNRKVVQILDPTTGYIYRQFQKDSVYVHGQPNYPGQYIQYIKGTPVYLCTQVTEPYYRYYSWRVRIGMDPTFCSTINNLENPITKTDTQTMRVTYIIDYNQNQIE